MEVNKVPFGRKLAFAVGDFFGGGSFNIVNFLYPGFLALTVGIPAYWAGIVMLVARVWDAVSDPLMGLISDRTSSRMGKRRIYILIAAPLVLASFFLMFYPYAFSSLALRVTAVMASYIFFCTAQTMVMIPYISLSAEMSSDYAQRANVNTWRLGFSIFSSIICVALPQLIVNAFDVPGRGYIAMSLLFGTVFMVLLLITALFAKEEIISPPSTAKFRLSGFTKPLKLAPFRQYLAISLCTTITMAIMSGLFFFYVDFYIMRDATAKGEANMVGLIAAAIMFTMQIVALPFYLWLIGKTSKVSVYRVGALIWIAGSLCLFLLKPGTPLPMLYALAVVLGFGISGAGLIPHTVFGDVIDAAQLEFGERNEGSFGGLANFISKVAQAVGLAIVMAMLGGAGFVEREPGMPPITAQPESAQTMLVAVMALSPLLFMTIGILVSRRYTIDKEHHDEILAKIAARGDSSAG